MKFAPASPLGIKVAFLKHDTIIRISLQLALKRIMVEMWLDIVVVQIKGGSIDYIPFQKPLVLQGHETDEGGRTGITRTDSQ